MANDNVLPFLLQNALSLARPSAPASNQVLYQYALEDDTVSVSDTMTATVIPTGYPYGWGEFANLSGATDVNVDNSTGSSTITAYQQSLMMFGVLYTPQ